MPRMFWNSRPPRSAYDPLLDGDAGLRSIPGLFGPGSGRFGAGLSGPYRFCLGRLQNGRIERRCRPFRRAENRAGGRPGDRLGDQGRPEPEEDSRESANSAKETDHLAQPSDPDGVGEDMATLVLDKPALGSGHWLTAGPPARRLLCRITARMSRATRRSCCAWPRAMSRASIIWWKSITGA